MRVAVMLTSIAALAGIAGAGSISASNESPTVKRAAHDGLVVVELYQSQGCSSCPPALANLMRIADRPDVLALSFGVTYWDYLGWKDSFASPQFTKRQWDYAHRNGRAEVATPQVWIDGRTTLVGSDRRQLDDAIGEAAPLSGPAISANHDVLRIEGAAVPAGASDVWIVRYDPRTIEVPIHAGENNGRTIPHRNIVRSLEHLGLWTGNPTTIALPPSPDARLKSAILLQRGAGGPITAALKL